jgi:preprotein translocase subunit SecG
MLREFRLPCAVNYGILGGNNMETAKLIVIILDMIVAVLLTLVITIQSGKSAGLSGAIAGSSESFLSKGGSKTMDARLARATKWIGLAFVLLSLLAVILISASAN